MGGAAGAIARYLAGSGVAAFGAGFPWGTLAVNVSGSVLLGYVSRGLPEPELPPRVRAFLAVGFCGAFTTFSAFDLETLTFLREGKFALAAIYSLGSVLTCVAGVALGLRGFGGRRRVGVPPRDTTPR